MGGDWGLAPQQIIREGLVQVMNQNHRNFSTLEYFASASLSYPGHTGLMQRQKKNLKAEVIWRMAETTG